MLTLTWGWIIFETLLDNPITLLVQNDSGITGNSEVFCMLITAHYGKGDLGEVVIPDLICIIVLFPWTCHLVSQARNYYIMHWNYWVLKCCSCLYKPFVVIILTFSFVIFWKKSSLWYLVLLITPYNSAQSWHFQYLWDEFLHDLIHWIHLSLV